MAPSTISRASAGRWVYRPKDASLHPGTMEVFSQPVRWMGYRPVFGKRRVRFYSCDDRADGLETLRPVNGGDAPSA